MEPVPCVGRFLDTVSQPADQVVDADTILGETEGRAQDWIC
jgi:hypothetical protein